MQSPSEREPLPVRRHHCMAGQISRVRRPWEIERHAERSKLEVTEAGGLQHRLDRRARPLRDPEAARVRARVLANLESRLDFMDEVEENEGASWAQCAEHILE